jgi:hypothetical protein
MKNRARISGLELFAFVVVEVDFEALVAFLALVEQAGPSFSLLGIDYLEAVEAGEHLLLGLLELLPEGFLLLFHGV